MVQIGNFLFKYRNGILPLLFFGIFIPSPVIFANPIFALALGLTMSVAGQIIRFATIGLVYIIRGGRDKRVYAEKLVTTGIFAHCRNPLYVGNILVGCGMGLASNNMAFFIMISVIITFFYQAIVLAEERFLKEKFGEHYSAYMVNVNRWIPSFTHIHDTFVDHAFAWRRVILKEYNSTFSGTTLAFLLIAKSILDNPHYFQNPRRYYTLLLISWTLLAFVYVWIKFLKKTHRLKET